jgi:hypothetical protein
MRSNNEHHGLLHWPQQVHDLPQQLWNLDNRGGKTMAAGAKMWESKMLTEDQMVAWENKPTANQTRANLQTYFMEKWLKRHQYLAATAKQSQFKQAALAA